MVAWALALQTTPNMVTRVRRGATTEGTVEGVLLAGKTRWEVVAIRAVIVTVIGKSEIGAVLVRGPL